MTLLVGRALHSFYIIIALNLLLDSSDRHADAIKWGDSIMDSLPLHVHVLMIPQVCHYF